MGDFWAELKRRNIVKVGIAYGIVAWVLVQIASVFASAFTFPAVVMQIVIFFLALGFPVAVIFAWAFELTPEGLKRTDQVAPEASVTKETGQRLNRIIIGVLSLAVVLLLVDRFVLTGGQREAENVAENQVPLGERSYESIAVLPFVNMSNDKEQEYFSDGISEELLNLLAKTKGLRVAARTSSFAFKGMNQDIKKIGNELDVETVLEGSVRKANTKLRVTAQLIDVDTGYHLWSDTYDRELDDVFEIQDEISAAIVNALQVHFGGEVVAAAKSTEVNVEAYQHFLMGRDLVAGRTVEGLNKAVDYFTQAIEVDENYAAAYAGKADAYMLLSDSPGSYGEMPLKFAHELAAPLIEKALALGPELPDGHASKGFYLYQQQKLEEAIDHFDEALALQPSHAMAQMWKALALSGLSKRLETLEALELAYKIDPLSLVVSHNLVIWRLAFGDIVGADKIAKRMREVAPDRADRWLLAERIVALARRDYSAVYESIQYEEENYPDATEATGASVLLDLGATDKSLELQEPLGRVNTFTNLGRCDEATEIYSNLPEKDKALPFYFGAGTALAIICGDAATALESLQKFIEATGFEERFWFGGGYSDMPAPFMYSVYAKSGEEEAAARVRQGIEEAISDAKTNGVEHLASILVARVRLVDGDLEGALDALEVAEENNQMNYSDANFFFEPLFGHPRYEALVQKLKAHTNKERADLGWEPLPE